MPLPNPAYFTDIHQLRDLFNYPHLLFELNPARHPNFDYTIYPGQPLSVHWSVSDYSNHDLSGSYTAIVYYEDNVVLDMGSGRIGDILPDHLPRLFYTVGQSRTLQIRITGPNSNQGTWSTAEFIIDVVGDNVDTSIFEWRPTPFSVRWKQDSYTVGVNCNNRSQWSALSGMVTINEDNSNTATIPSRSAFASQTISVPRTGSIIVAFPGITQNWSWFDRAVLFQTAPMTIDFSYSLTYTLNDEYGNAYEGTMSATLSVEVSVAVAKRLELAGASAAQIGALIAIAAAAIAWAAAVVLLAIAAGLETAAQIGATAALDPPAPDPDFLDPVNIVSPPLPKVLWNPKSPNDFVTMLGFVNHILAALDAISKTQSKLMGATNAKSQKGIDIQKEGYRNILSQIADDATKLLELAPKVNLLSFANTTQKALTKTLTDWQKNGIPEDLHKQWRAAGYSDESWSSVEKALGDSHSVKQAHSAKTNMEKLASALGQIVLEVWKEGQSILASTDSVITSK
jgi:hypothetical protein